MKAGGEPMEKHENENGKYLKCGECGLMQDGEKHCCGFCLSALRTTSRSFPTSSGLATTSGSFPTSSGLATTSRSFPTSSGLATTSGSFPTSSGLATTSGSFPTSSGLATSSRSFPSQFALEADPGEILEQLRQEHWGWKEQWNAELARTVVGSEEAACHGEQLEFMEDVLLELESELLQCGGEPEGVHSCLKAVREAQEAEGAHPVLQTYTVGLAEIRRNIEQRKPAIQKELESLFETTQALKKTTIEELTELPGGDQAEQAPAKIVSTIKAPDGRKKIRICDLW